MLLRWLKIMMVASIALFFSLTAYDNIVDHSFNLNAVQHVLVMDTISKSSTLMNRSISNISTQKIAFGSIIATETLAALFSWLGAILLFWYRRDPVQFVRKKQIANLGLGIGLLLYLLGFLVIAGEWFVMWQSTQWNAEQTASYLSIIILASLIFLNQEENA